MLNVTLYSVQFASQIALPDVTCSEFQCVFLCYITVNWYSLQVQYIFSKNGTINHILLTGILKIRGGIVVETLDTVKTLHIFLKSRESEMLMISAFGAHGKASGLWITHFWSSILCRSSTRSCAVLWLLA